MANTSKKVSVGYRFEQSVVDMINTIATEEKRSINNTLEMIITKYYKETRSNEKMKNLSNDEIKEIVCKEYNKMANDLDWDILNSEDFKVIKEILNVEFRERAYHIDNGQYSLRSGIESKHWVNSIKTNDQYLVTKICFNDIFSNQKNEKEIMKIDYMV